MRPGQTSPVRQPPPTTTGPHLFAAWIAVVAVCALGMAAWPEVSTVPCYVVWASFVVLSGRGDWPLRRTVTGLAVATVAAGAAVAAQAVRDELDWVGAAQVPLMTVLAALVVWQVRLRQGAMAALTIRAEHDRSLAAERDRLTRQTSHELRTPLTIARGYLELVASRTVDPQQRLDLAVIDDELGRITRITDRLVRAILLPTGVPTQVDLDLVLRQTVERWAQVADRRWVLEAAAGTFDGSAEGIRACLDTLLENAVRYTRAGDTVRLTGLRDGGRIEISVADSGPGLAAPLIAALNSPVGTGTAAGRDDLSQTGLGLGLVRSVVTAHRGRLLTGTAREGGALVRMTLPVADADRDPGFVHPPTPAEVRAEVAV
ncbi:sensor histidine kinase [Pengzhenrongella frigida]|uniref:histidine kinase n=1 Tax=Pengzhenrongella frigida TaxID=1259133 RepID=A0A4Q5N345_9MICO|nr:HAMP domain-containing sensor histidine kinase [Cellulomonas sp. HLT2-17]RYV51673.1 HAMP domain-containing histidine kinase [Cellulomonas sp. HLT2-17]